MTKLATQSSWLRSCEVEIRNQRTDQLELVTWTVGDYCRLDCPGSVMDYFWHQFGDGIYKILGFREKEGAVFLADLVYVAGPVGPNAKARFNWEIKKLLKLSPLEALAMEAEDV